jgi:hypothetical protein
VDLKEFNIKDNVNDISEYILTNNYEVVGISCYIWNIELVKQLLDILRKHNVIVILGGPEVSYNASYYLDNNLCDYVIKKNYIFTLKNVLSSKQVELVCQMIGFGNLNDRF